MKYRVLVNARVEEVYDIEADTEAQAMEPYPLKETDDAKHNS